MVLLISSSIVTPVLLVKRCLVGTLSLWRQSRQVPPLTVLPIQDRCVSRDAVVPADHCPLLPLHARLEICAEGYMVVEEFQQVITLFLLESYDPTGELQRDLSNNYKRNPQFEAEAEDIPVG